jgi:HSP20 family molecular chaperone IbpA
MDAFWNEASRSSPWADWEKYREWLAKQFPWDIGAPWEKLKDPNWLDKYVDQVLRDDGFPDREAVPPAPAANPSVAVSRQDNYVTVTIRLPARTDLRRLRLYASADFLKLTGLPDLRSRIVRLPCPVIPRSGRASLRDGRLTVRLRRRFVRTEEVELFISG